MDVFILIAKFALILWFARSQIRAARRPSAAGPADAVAATPAEPAFTASRAA
jgi:hypothetical protein